MLIIQFYKRQRVGEAIPAVPHVWWCNFGNYILADGLAMRTMSHIDFVPGTGPNRLFRMDQYQPMLAPSSFRRLGIVAYVMLLLA